MQSVSPSMSGSDLGSLLQGFRRRRGWSQEELAERVDPPVSVGTVANIERGRTRPYRHTVDTLAVALGLDRVERAALAEAREPTREPARVPARVPRPARAAVYLLRSSPPSPTPAPMVATTALVGRAAAVAELTGLLVDDGLRLVTLLGPGGVGKTRLAAAVAAVAAARFDDGVIWVDLAPLVDPALVFPTITRAVGLRARDDRDVVDQLADHLESQRVLLVVDNWEQVVTAAAELNRLLGRCRGVHVLATSRVPLRVRGERRWEVLPLPVPDSSTLDVDDLAGVADVDGLAGVASVDLFLQRARDSAPGFALTAANAGAVAAICAGLDGMPLALELAAARLGILTPADLLHRLVRPLRVLAHGPRDLPERQRTMRATIAWSHDLLEPGEQELFRNIGIFAGGAALSTVETVCADPDAPGGDLDGDLDGRDTVLDRVTALVEHHLLEVAPGRTGEPRLTLREPVREYALDQLSAAGAGADQRTRHARHYEALAGSAADGLRGPEQREWLLRLDDDLDNLRAALSWTARTTSGLRLASRLVEFWWRSGHLTEGRDILVRALADARAGGEVASRAGSGIEAEAEANAAANAGAEALTGIGVLTGHLGHGLDSQRWLTDAVAHWRSLGSVAAARRGLAGALAELGRVDSESTGDPDRAAPLFTEAAQLFEELDDRSGLGRVLSYQAAFVHLERGDYPTARALQERALALAEASGDSWSAAIAHLDLGEVARASGDDRRAESLYGRALEGFRDLGDRWYEAAALHDLGYTALHQGHLERARSLFTASRALSQRVGNQRGVAECLVGQAAVAHDEGDPAHATALIVAADDLLTHLGARLNHVDQVEHDRIPRGVPSI